MRDRTKKKVPIEDVRERMNPGGQKPKEPSDEEAQTPSSKSMIRLDHSRLLKIDDDNSIVEQVAMADVITARTHSNEREECLFKRPQAETKAHGRPYEFHTLNFSVQNVKDLRYLTEAIGRMKQRE